MQFHSSVACIILPFFPLFSPFCNVARFITSGYLYKNFIFLCCAFHRTLLLVNISVCPPSLFHIFTFFQYPQPPINLRVTLLRGVSGLSRKIMLGMIPCVCIWTHIIFSGENYFLRSWYINWDNMLNPLIIPSNQKNVTIFFCIWWWVRLLLDKCLMILDLPQHPYNKDYYCFVCIKTL